MDWSAELGPPLGLREHGGTAARELAARGLAPDDLLDLSQSVNPFGPPPAVATAIRDAPLDRYPDPTALPARAALGASLGVDPARVVVGNGAADLLWTLARAVLEPGDRVLVVEPTFSELRAAARFAGASVVEWRAAFERGFSIDLCAAGEVADRAAVALAYVCAPNNPTGVAIPAPELAAFAAARPRVLVAIDEAFLSLSDRYADAALELPRNAVRIRSLTKELGTPGVRAGYLVAAPEVAARLEAARPPWTTSAAAEAATVAGCRASGCLADARRRLLAERDRLAAELRSLGLTVVPSSTIFLLVRVGDGARWRDRLLTRHRVAVRDCASFGLPEFVRVAVRTPDDGERLLEAVRAERACAGR